MRPTIPYGQFAYPMLTIIAVSLSILAQAAPLTLQDTKELTGHAAGRYSLEFSHDSSFLAVLDSTHQLILWDLKRAAVIARFKHKEKIRRAHFSPDSKILVTVDESNRHRFRSTRDGEETTGWLAKTPNIRQIAFNPDMSRVAILSGEYRTELRDAVSGRVIKEIPGRILTGENDPFTKGRGDLIAIGPDGILKRWGADDGRERQELGRLPLRGDIDVATFSPAGKWLVTAHTTPSPKIYLVDLSAKRPTHELHGENFSAYAEYQYPVPAFDPMETRILAITPDGKAQVLSTSSGKVLATFGEHDAGIEQAQFSNEGHNLVTASSSNGRVEVWNIATRRLLQTKKLKDVYGDGSILVTLSPKGDRAILWDSGDTILWDLQNNRQLQTLSDSGENFHPAFSANGNVVLVSGSDSVPDTVWDAKSGHLLAQSGKSGEETATASYQFNHHGNRLAIAQRNGVIRVLIFE